MADADTHDTPPDVREVRFEYSREFPSVLEHLRAALVVSTYQAGKLVVVGVHEGQLRFGFHSFDRVMGVAVGPRQVAVGTRRQIYFLQASHELSPGVEPAGTHDACWLTRGSIVTGNVHGHELAWGHDGLWLVNTLFSSLCTLHDGYSFVPRWRPPFITELADQDRCHLNGLAMQDGRPRFVTAHAESNEPAGWRPTKATSGCVIDVPTGQTVARGLCMPHSPRWHAGRLWCLDSGNGRLVSVDPSSGHVQAVEQLPGYTRGLSFCGQFAFVGMSKIRETAIFGGVPIAEHRDELRCGVAVVDLVSGRAVAWLQFHTGVDEIFAVDVLPGCKNPVFSGPTAEEDGRPEIWVVPPDGQIPASERGSSDYFSSTLVAAFTPLPAPVITEQPASNRSDSLTQVHPSSERQLELRLAEAAQLHRQGRLVESLEQYKQAAETAPERADILNDLGNLYQELDDQQAALSCYRRAVQIQGDFVAAHQNLGYLLFNHGEPQQALVHYQQAQRQQPSAINQLLSATVLPVVYDSADDVRHWRARYTEGVHALAEEGVHIDTTRAMLPTNFFLAYQGENDRDLARDLGRIYQGVELCTAAAKATAGRRLRVGFLSAYFRDHTIGRLNLGRVRHLSREAFEVTVIYAGRHRDEMTLAFEHAADRFVVVPRQVEAARRQIADLGLDILLFTDVGMDALTYTLAFSRMAPVQCVTWGHPDTTGSPTMDYFISSELLEAEEGDEHYSETLVRLPNLGTYYVRPELSGPARPRAYFGLAAERHVYLCPQTLFKFHPDFDAALSGILRADPLGEVVLINGRVANWTERLQRRFARTLGEDASRVHFLPAQPNADFLQLLRLADVLLDPFPFGGGNSSYEALAMGTPIVTWPSRFLRGRITLALYRKMGVMDCVVGSAEEYVKVATQLACDRVERQSIRQRIQDAGRTLFEDPAEVRRARVLFFCSPYVKRNSFRLRSTPQLATSPTPEPPYVKRNNGIHSVYAAPPSSPPPSISDGHSALQHLSTARSSHRLTLEHGRRPPPNRKPRFPRSYTQEHCIRCRQDPIMICRQVLSIQNATASPSSLPPFLPSSLPPFLPSLSGEHSKPASAAEMHPQPAGQEAGQHDWRKRKAIARNGEHCDWLGAEPPSFWVARWLPSCAT